MRTSLVLLSLLLCGLLIAGCTSTTTNGTTAVATASAPTTQSTTTDTSAPISITSTPTATYTIGCTTAGTLRVSVLDVGQGDSILIQSPAGKTMLVDAGDTDAGSRIVADLKARGVTSLDAAVASHAHADHIGGYQAVLSQFSVGTFYDSGYPSTSSIYENLLTTVDQKNIKFITPTAGQTIDLDPAVRIDVISPDGKNTGEIHDNMLVLRLSYGSTSFLLTGDMPDNLEKQIYSSFKPTTVLKVGHHGSRTSSSAAFLNAIKPEVAIISVGTGNSYGHPTAEALSRLQAVGAKIYRTDQAGTVTVTTDGNTYTVATDKTGSSAPVQVAVTAVAQAAAPVGVTQQQNSVPASSGSGTVAIAALDLQGEKVTITNSGSSSVSLTGWKLTDEGAKHSYTFTGTTVPAAGSVTIASGTATGDIKWKSDNIWNNDGDTAYLYDGSGRLVSQRRG